MPIVTKYICDGCRGEFEQEQTSSLKITTPYSGTCMPIWRDVEIEEYILCFDCMEAVKKFIGELNE